MSQGSHRAGAVAAITLAGVALSLATVYVASKRLADGLQGPSKIARAPDGKIWVASHGRLHRFSASGKREEIISLSDLGRSPIVSDLLPLSDGSVVIAEAEPSAAYRCDLAARLCASLTGRIAAQVGPTRHALMIAADEKERRFYVSDNANHRLILLDFDGKVLDVTAARRVIYPNELAMTKSGELVVVDTNHHRLARISVAKDAFGADLWQMRTDASALYRPGRTWPMDFAPAPRGGWWVLNARSGMKDADLLLFDAAGTARKRVDLGEDSDPTQILALDGGVLVAEPTEARLLQVSAEGTVAGPWGDAGFNAELEALRASRSLWRNVRLAAQVLVLALPLGAIWILMSLGEPLALRAPWPPELTPAPVADGIHWIGVRPRVRRRTHIVMYVAGAALLAFGAVPVVLMWRAAPEAALPRGPVAVALGLLAAIVLAHVLVFTALRRAFRLRLGTDGRDFFFDPGDGRLEQCPLASLATANERQLLAGKRLIPLYGALGAMFDADDVRAYIFARMAPGTRLGVLRLLGQALRRGNELLWLFLVVAFLAFVVFLPFYFPGIPARLKELL